MPKIKHVASKASGGSAREAVATLKRHFAAVLGYEKIGEEELRAFRAAALAIAHDRQALALLGIALIDALMAHYVRQLDQLLEAERAQKEVE